MTRRILLIDDEASLRRVTQLTLRITAGWQVLVASSGQAGLQQAEVEQPDAILLDWMMPDMDGMITLRQLKKNPSTQNIPVIVLTAKVQLMPQQQLEELGVAAVIIKPFDPLSLVQQIQTALNWS